MTGVSGVFLFGFGAPRSLDREDLADFLRCVTGRDPSEVAISSLAERYREIGGSSPLVEISRRQAVALERELSLVDIPLKVYFGMRCGEPSLQNAVDAAKADGVTDAVVLTHAPQFSVMVSEAYKNGVDGAVTRADASIKIHFVDSYGTHPGFIEAMCEQLKTCLSTNGLSPQSIPVIFSAHSLPDITGKVERYIEELRKGAAAISKSVGIGNYCVAFQSPGRGGGNWLGPSVEEAVQQIAGEVNKSAVVCPLGFVPENLETLYDLDIAAARFAKSLGVNFYRVKALNDSPHLIRAWAEIVREKIEALS